MDLVLVHGTTQAAPGFDRLASALEDLGHRAHAVDLPADQPGWVAVDYADYLKSALHLDDRPVVAAHSGSGIVLPAIAETLDAIRMVWLAAYVPVPGRSLLSEIRSDPEAMFNGEWIGEDPTDDLVAAAYFLFHDCDYEAMRWALGTLRRFYPEAAYDDPFAGYPDIPSTYVVCLRDRTIRPEWQRQRAVRQLGAEIIEMDAGHAPYVSQPDVFARHLDAGHSHGS